MRIDVGMLYMHSINLTEKAEELRLLDQNEKLMTLIERAADLGNLATLYYEELSEEEIKKVDTVMSLSENTYANAADETVDYSSLEAVIDSLETLFREKKLILGESKERIVA